MKKVIFMLTILAAIATGPQAQSNDEDRAARVPLENYLKGHATGDGSYMLKAFYPTAHVEGIREGKIASRTLDEYVRGFSGKPSPEESLRKRWIESVEVSGNAAIAKVRFDYPEVDVTDYMLLLKIDGDWKIVNKIYQVERKTPPNAGAAK